MYIISVIFVMYISIELCYTYSVRWNRTFGINADMAESRCEMTLSDQRKEYLYEYQKAKLKRIPLDVTKEKYEEIKAAAHTAGETVNGYIKKAIDERIERESEV